MVYMHSYSSDYKLQNEIISRKDICPHMCAAWHLFFDSGPIRFMSVDEMGLGFWVK